MKAENCPQDTFKEEWEFLFELLEVVAANQFPGIWLDGNEYDAAATSNKLLAETKRKIESLEERHTCASCHSDFEDGVGRNAVALSCSKGQRHFLCRKCFVL